MELKEKEKNESLEAQIDNTKKKITEFSKEEQNIIDQCIPFYRVKIMPDTPLKEIEVGNAVEFSHSKGKFINNKKQHNLMYAIFDKLGIEYETNEVRQIRLKRERMQKISEKRMGHMDSLIAEKEAELKETKKQKEDIEANMKAMKEQEEGITTKEVNAKKAQVEAEAEAEVMKTEMEAMKIEMEAMKALIRKQTNETNLKGAAKELAKEENAKLEPELTKEPPAEVKTEEPPTIDIEPEKEEKTIDELIEGLK